MPSKLSLYNGALRHLGQRSLANLTENREPRRLLDEVWDDGFLDGILEQGWWKHASRGVQLSPNPSFVRQFGYNYQFTQPSDMVKLCAFTLDEYMEITIDRYLDEGGAWYCNQNPIWVQYVSNDVSYGLNFAGWPQSFNEYAQAALAGLSASRFKKTPQEKQDIERQEKLFKHDALSKDALKGPTKRPTMGSWNQARRGWGASGIDRLRGGRLIG